jgi:hypothetical protein
MYFPCGIKAGVMGFIENALARRRRGGRLGLWADLSPEF